MRVPVCVGGGRRLNGQTSRCEAGREQQREHLKQRDEECQRTNLLAENRALRKVDAEGLIRAGKLAEQRDERTERDEQLY